MSAPQIDWDGMLQVVNAMRREGRPSLYIAKHLGIPKNTLCSRLGSLRQRGYFVEPAKCAPVPKAGEAHRNRIDYAALMPEVKRLALLGMNVSEIVKIVKIVKGDYNTLKSRIYSQFSTEERKAWEAAKDARKAKSKKAPKTKPTPPAPSPLHPQSVARAKEAGDPITWGAIWGGNPPPYPHELMRTGRV